MLFDLSMQLISCLVSWCSHFGEFTALLCVLFVRFFQGINWFNSYCILQFYSVSAIYCVIKISLIIVEHCIVLVLILGL